LSTLQLDNLLLHHPANGGLPQLKLCDFGLSKDEAEGAAYSSCGTPEYMAPEVRLESHPMPEPQYCVHETSGHLSSAPVTGCWM
jgi:serine/threonine protein kinase